MAIASSSGNRANRESARGAPPYQFMTGSSTISSPASRRDRPSSAADVPCSSARATSSVLSESREKPFASAASIRPGIGLSRPIVPDQSTQPMSSRTWLAGRGRAWLIGAPPQPGAPSLPCRGQSARLTGTVYRNWSDHQVRRYGGIGSSSVVNCHCPAQVRRDTASPPPSARRRRRRFRRTSAWVRGSRGCTARRTCCAPAPRRRAGGPRCCGVVRRGMVRPAEEGADLVEPVQHRGGAGPGVVQDGVGR